MFPLSQKQYRCQDAAVGVSSAEGAGRRILLNPSAVHSVSFATGYPPSLGGSPRIFTFPLPMTAPGTMTKRNVRTLTVMPTLIISTTAAETLESTGRHIHHMKVNLSVGGTELFCEGKCVFSQYGLGYAYSQPQSGDES